MYTIKIKSLREEEMEMILYRNLGRVPWWNNSLTENNTREGLEMTRSSIDLDFRGYRGLRQNVLGNVLFGGDVLEKQ